MRVRANHRQHQVDLSIWNLMTRKHKHVTKTSNKRSAREKKTDVTEGELVAVRVEDGRDVPGVVLAHVDRVGRGAQQDLEKHNNT